MRVICGPVGSGKSALCVMDLLRKCEMQKHGSDGRRRSRWAVIRNTASQLKDTTIKTFFDWVPAGIAGTWKESERTFFLSYKDVEAEILFRPLDSPADIQRVLSLELTGAWLNECREIPSEIVDAVQGRLGRYPSQRHGGFSWTGMICDTNPPDEDTWWADHMTGSRPANWEVFRQPSGLSAEAENRENLPPDYYENLCIGKSKDWINVYVHGEFGRSLAGRPVYENTFNPDIHLSKVPLKPIPNHMLVIGMDFGLTPAAVLGQMSPTGALLILEEVVGFNMGIERFVETRLRPVLHARYSTNPVIIIGDPTGAYRVGTDEGSVFRTLKKKYKFKVVPASTNAPAPRVTAVEHFLTLLIDGKGGMLIDKHRCPWLVQGFRSKYFYEKKRDGTIAASPKKNDWSHVHDGCQYLCLHMKEGHGAMSQLALSQAHDEDMFVKEAGASPVYAPGVW